MGQSYRKDPRENNFSHKFKHKKKSDSFKPKQEREPSLRDFQAKVVFGEKNTGTETP